MAWDEGGLTRALDLLAQRYRGPGGVAGVVRNGQVVARRAWGHADMSARLAMTAATRLPICSVSKQFTCAVLLDQVADPATLDPFVADYLPQFRGPLPTVRDLAGNRSGLRDYWALTVLQGAFPEQEFRRSDALPLLARMKTGHFAPGTSVFLLQQQLPHPGRVDRAGGGARPCDAAARADIRAGRDADGGVAAGHAGQCRWGGGVRGQ